MQTFYSTKQFLAIICLSLLLGACVSSNSGHVYSRDETRKLQTIKTGVVESVRTVTIEGTKTPIGVVAGGAIGGIAGGGVGDGRGSHIFSILGGILGGLVGSVAEEAITRKDGLEITVKLDHGDLVTIVQEADEVFHAGDQVRLIDTGSVTRVSH